MERVAGAEPPAVLVYDRIDENRRKSRGLLGAAMLGTLPSGLFVSAWAAAALIVSNRALMAVLAGGVDRLRTALAWQALTAGAIALVMLAAALFRYRTTRSSILRECEAQPVDGRDEDLRRLVESLCLGAGLPVPAVYVSNSAVANAFVVGVRPDERALVVTRGLLQALDRLELEGVLAHELCHLANDDVRLNTVLAGILRAFVVPLPLQVLLVACWLYAALSSWMFPSVTLAGPTASLESEPRLALALLAQFGAVDLPWGALFGVQSVLLLWAFAWPGIGRVLQRVLSRRLEFQADAQAVLLTRYPDGLARALLRIGAIDSGDRALGGPQVAHLMIVGPPNEHPGLSSHPAIEARVAALVGMGSAGVEELRARSRVRVPAAASAPALTPPRPASAAAADDTGTRIRGGFEAAMLGLAVMAWVLGFDAFVALVVPGSPGSGLRETAVAGLAGYAVAVCAGFGAGIQSATSGASDAGTRALRAWVVFACTAAPFLALAGAFLLIEVDRAAQDFCGMPHAASGAGSCASWLAVAAYLIAILCSGLGSAFLDRIGRAIYGTPIGPGSARPPRVATTSPRASAETPSLQAPSAGPRRCPKCGGGIEQAATRCEWCGEALTTDLAGSAPGAAGLPAGETRGSRAPGS